MKKMIISSMIVAVLVFTGGAAAAESFKDSHTLNNEVVSAQAAQAMNDIQLSRNALFNGQTQQAKTLANQAENYLKDNSVDWTKYIRYDKKAPVNGDNYIRIGSEVSVSENYQLSKQKSDAIDQANQHIKAGDKQGALDALKLAGVAVTETQELMPLHQTENDVANALTLMKQDKYYQAGMLLRSAEEGIIYDTQTYSELPVSPTINHSQTGAHAQSGNKG